MLTMLQSEVRSDSQRMGELTFQNGKYFFRTQNFQDLQEVKEAGFIFDAESLRWGTRNAVKARRLRRFADQSAEQKFKNTFITEFAPPEHIPFPDHLSPRTWQIESAWHCVTRSPAYCADEAGMGKTPMAAMCLNAVPGRAIIVCPAFLKWNWREEVTTWSTTGQTVNVIETGDDGEGSYQADTVIVPDSLIAKEKVQAQLRRWKWRWLIIDEFHRYKEEKTKRTQAVVGGEKDGRAIKDLAERIVLLSGTPFPNGRPIELYPALSQLAPEAIGFRTVDEYGKTFCAGRKVKRYEGKRPLFTWDFSGASNLDRLGKELSHRLMIRHEKADHLKELGPKTRRLIFLDQPDRLHKFEARLLKEHSMEELLGEDAALGDIAAYRREVGEAKIADAVEYITNLLENSAKKVVAFAHHVKVVEILARELEAFGALKIRGGMNAKDKQAAVKLFQTKERHRVVVGNIESMGVGVTLTKAPRAVMVEWDWRPGITEQAEDRLHRLTQEEHVCIDYLVHRNSLDERMLRSSIVKQGNINSVMKGTKR